MKTIELIEKVKRLGLETKCDEHKIEINDKKGITVCLINRKHCFIFTTDYYVNERFPYSFKEALLEIVLQYASTPIEEREKADDKMRFTKMPVLQEIEKWFDEPNTTRKELRDRIDELDDTPEKVVVPEFIANYLCRAKTDIGLMRVFEIANTKNELERWKKEYDWIRKNSEKFAKAWIDGYTIEQDTVPEQYYTVVIADRYLVHLFLGRTDYRFVEFDELCAWKPRAFQLTEAEIKAIDERYWTFAVPVKEVAEREIEPKYKLVLRKVNNCFVENFHYVFTEKEWEEKLKVSWEAITSIYQPIMID